MNNASLVLEWKRSYQVVHSLAGLPNIQGECPKCTLAPVQGVEEGDPEGSAVLISLPGAGKTLTNVDTA